MTLDNQQIGFLDNRPVHQLTMSNTNGQTLVLYNYGITIQSWQVNTKKQGRKDILLGRNDWNGYLQDHPNFGCIIGRYANRISKGHLPIEDRTYQLSKNLNGHHLHGGYAGFGKKVWDIENVLIRSKEAEIHFVYISQDGEEGYPGNLTAKVIVRFTEENELIFDMYASTDKDTVCNMSQHCYFNLGNEENVLNHELHIKAFKITETDIELIPTGILKNVEGSPFDFTKPKKIGTSIHAKDTLLMKANGYDVNYVSDNNRNPYEEPVARVSEENNEIQLNVYTSLPGLQLYTGNWLEGTVGKNEQLHKKYGGLCLEPQFFPDSPHHPNFPDTILRNGEEYHHWIKYKVISA